MVTEEDLDGVREDCKREDRLEAQRILNSYRHHLDPDLEDESEVGCWACDFGELACDCGLCDEEGEAE